ncbi:adenylyltransferase/cytidyltransferase family protein [Candidatus Berkelbacteria bacterium]|nr:adenylyltransferase/cytidyltransferase family protein [Candidatus Berkelbacteria bacterium]
MEQPPPSRIQLKIVKNYAALAKLATGLRAVGRKTVVTIGSWDMLHIGHVRYLLKARNFGDTLIVGVDSDRAIKLYKGPLRPVVPEDERCEMLSYQEGVDFVTLIDDVDEDGVWNYELIKAIKPNVFVAVEGSYPENQLAEIKKYADKLVVLSRQANTSTSVKIEDTVKNHLEQMYGLIAKKRNVEEVSA